jgi:hypothetical protein
MLKNILAVFVGIIAGSAVNMGLITIGPMVIPPPEGVDVTDLESMKAGAHLFEARHFLFPLLAHAAGTLVGACVAYWVAATHKSCVALVIGVFFLVGGIMMAFSFPSPIWFMVVDLVGCYIPMAILGGRLASHLRA